MHCLYGIRGKVRDLGSILVNFIAICVALVLIYRSNERRAAVGRREIQIFLAAYMLVCACDLVVTGRFLDSLET